MKTQNFSATKYFLIYVASYYDVIVIKNREILIKQYCCIFALIITQSKRIVTIKSPAVERNKY